MKRTLYLLTLLSFFGILPLWGQTTPQGLNYQAVARDVNGAPMAGKKISLRFSMSSKNEALQPYYSEVHHIQTDELGLFNLVVGQGEVKSGEWTEIPWAKESIWLNIEMAEENQPFQMVSSTQLLAVPYALHAESASQLVGNDAPTEKNQSIYWTTAGNTQTNSNVHYIGTRDNQPLVFKTNNISQMTLTTDGKLNMVPKNPAGSDDQKASYPLVVEGTQNTQGVWIQINGSRSNANNFVTFADDNGIQGRIEGETISELESTTEYKVQVAVFALHGVSLLAQIVGLYAEGVGLAASGWAAGSVPGVIAQAVALTAESAGLLAESISWSTRVHNEVGVSYASHGADYAEWLERAPGVRDLTFGEIVGVKGGLISLNTKDADHFMVVSQKPIVLGNEPKQGKEIRFEKVAFMGQVMTKIAGPVRVGDYVLPSGNNDGIGVAISPAKMKTGDYKRIIGVAWGEAPDLPLNIVNVAIGINTNDVTQKVIELNQKIEGIMAYLEGRSNTLKPSNTTLSSPTAANVPSTQFNKLMSDEAFDQFVDQHSDLFRELYAQVRQQLNDKGFNWKNNPQIDVLLNDPVAFTKKLRRDPTLLTQWSMLDQKIESAH